MPGYKPQYLGAIAHIDALAPIWQERMGLGHFDIEHVYLDSFYGDDGEEDFKITATTESRWNYLQAKVKWYMPSAVRHSDATLERTLVHELCHVVLSPEQSLIDARLMEVGMALGEAEFNGLQESYYDRLELATEMMARAVLGGWPILTT